MTCNSKCTPRPMAAFLAFVQHTHMAKDKGPRHHLRAWRKHRDLSLEAVAERVVLLSSERAASDPDVRPITMTHATLSRIERGKLPYNEHLMELLADIYQTDVASLIIRDPDRQDAIWDIWAQLAPVQREQVVEIARTLKRTGTDG
jgi:transcriptional regulator with XRE-family HTH domain